MTRLTMLTDSQIDLLKSAKLEKTAISVSEIAEIAELTDSSRLSDQQLIDFLHIVNALYRGGEALISDQVYDNVFLADLAGRHPRHPFLHRVEPETSFTGKTVKLPVRMLSTEKAYTRESIEKWLLRIEKAAVEIGLDYAALLFRITPKLDGYAAYDDGNIFYTRGDGRKGTDISRVFARGLKVGGNGGRGQGAGEIVVKRSYFAENLSAKFENARNFQASIIKEKDLDSYALEAIKQKAAVFYPFSLLPDIIATGADILQNFPALIEKVLKLVDYDVDGVIFEVMDTALKQHMGFTRHHHRWQIAFKKNIESAQVNVLQVSAQTSRSGRVNPVAELEPTRLSGALIRRATAHHFAMVKELGIGPGTLIELTRSGLVIPKIEHVIKAATAQIPDRCPSCSSELFWDGDYLYCPNNAHCPAQIEHTIEHFFRTLANIDGFGRKTVEKLHDHGINTVLQVYQLDSDRLQAMGFGEKTAQNLLRELKRSREEAIEDWRFLGAFGLHRMGLGNCERLLQHFPLTEIFSLDVEQIIAIDGFAEKTAAAIIICLKKIHNYFNDLYGLSFNLLTTPLLSDMLKTNVSSVIYDKVIVFSGTMLRGKRDDMKKEAKQLGAKVAASVTGKTDYLVAGEKVGEAKLTAAKAKGVKVLTEEEYITLLAD